MTVPSGHAEQVGALRAARRISIVGPGGAGKTTLADRLGQILGLPVVHLDLLYYASGWQGTDEKTWAAVQDRMTSDAEWIIEGNYAAPFGDRLRAADRVLFLDVPSSTCAVRTIQRWWASRWAQPLDLPRGMRHRLNPQAVWFGLQRRRLPPPPALMSFLQECPDQVDRIRTTAEARRLLDLLERPGHS